MVNLPGPAVVLLNALYHGQEDLSQELLAFSHVLEDLRAWLEDKGSYWSCPAEENLLANLRYLCGRIEEEVATPQWATLLPLLEEAYSLIEHVERQRRQADLVADPAVQEVLLGGLCRGKVLLHQAPALHDHVTRCAGLLSLARESIPEHVAGEVEQALARARAALTRVDVDRDAVEQFLGACHILEVIVEWDRRRRQDEQERFHRFAIPVVGGELEQILRLGRELGDRRQWVGGLRRARMQLLPTLASCWEGMRQGLLFPRACRATTIEAVDLALARLESAFSFRLKDPRPDEAILDALEEALQGAARAFLEVDQRALLKGPDEGIFYDLVQGLTRGTVADCSVAQLVQEEALEPRCLNALKVYLGNGDCEALIDFLAERAGVAPTL